MLIVDYYSSNSTVFIYRLTNSTVYKKQSRLTLFTSRVGLHTRTNENLLVFNFPKNDSGVAGGSKSKRPHNCTVMRFKRGVQGGWYNLTPKLKKTHTSDSDAIMGHLWGGGISPTWFYNATGAILMQLRGHFETALIYSSKPRIDAIIGSRLSNSTVFENRFKNVKTVICTVMRFKGGLRGNPTNYSHPHQKTR